MQFFVIKWPQEELYTQPTHDRSKVKDVVAEPPLLPMLVHLSPARFRKERKASRPEEGKKGLGYLVISFVKGVTYLKLTYSEE